MQARRDVTPVNGCVQTAVHDSVVDRQADKCKVHMQASDYLFAHRVRPKPKR
jgi:hypothetical protein